MTTGPATLPSAITTLTKRMADGWTHHITGPRTGTITVTALSDQPRGDGTRAKVEREVSVTSYMLKGCHHASGRAFRALWVHEHGKLTSKGKPSWRLDIAVRGRHEGEHAPQHLESKQLAAYVAAGTLAEYLAAADELAARKAAKQAGATELSDYGTTEGEAA
jgi:hypothetical protein